MTPFRFITSCAVALSAALVSSEALAHVKWFVDPTMASQVSFTPYQITDTAVLLWIGVMLSLAVIAVMLDRRVPSIPVADTKTRHDFIELLRIFTGMALLLTAYEGALIAPHLAVYGGLGGVLVFLQAVIGIMLIANRFILHAALLMLLLTLGIVVKFGLGSALEYFIIVGIALFLGINHLPTEASKERWKPYSVALLRICTGVSLIALAVSEKLAGAAMGQAFVANYDWNFMEMLGFSAFDDRLFVLSAGMMEATFGLILILGVMTRATMLAVSAFMLMSNLVFIAQGYREEALVEFVGHMPLIATALILLLLGYGQRLRITDLEVGALLRGLRTKPARGDA
ncbi:MAG: hypothetical protein AAF909_04895 [Pseudomonadota bacterium]